MILVDKDIRSRSSEIFVSHFDDRNVQPISYDIHIDEIIGESDNYQTYDLKPHEATMVRCQECIHVPNDLIIRKENKNSLIRLGLTVTSPVYNPGHQTPIYIRVENVSSNIITVEKNMAIAQMMFEQLSSSPELTYDKKIDASFNNEDKYRHLGNYEQELQNRTSKIERIKDNLENKEASIYTNILTMMGIFVSIFSLVSVNFSAINTQNITKDFLFTINISLGMVITLFIGLILMFFNKTGEKWKFIVFIIIEIILGLLLLIFI